MMELAGPHGQVPGQLADPGLQVLQWHQCQVIPCSGIPAWLLRQVRVWMVFQVAVGDILIDE